MLVELFENQHHLHLTKIYIIGIIFQGFYQYYITKDLDFTYFILYVGLCIITSLLFYRIFKSTK